MKRKPTPSTGWTRIDNGVIERIAEIGTTAFAVYAALAMHTDNKGKCFPSLARLAEIVGVSTRTVQRELRRLEKAGLVKVIAPGKTNGKSNVYQLTNPPPGSDMGVRGVGHGCRTRCDMGVGGGTTLVSPQQEPGNKTQLTRPNEQGAALDAITYPDGFDTPEVRQAIVDWLDHKKARRQGYKQPAKQISLLLRAKGDNGPRFPTPESFVAAVEHSIGCNYAGCFPPKGIANGTKQRWTVGPGQRHPDDAGADGF